MPIPHRHIPDAHDLLEKYEPYMNVDELHKQITFDCWMYFGQGVLLGIVLGTIIATLV